MHWKIPNQSQKHIPYYFALFILESIKPISKTQNAKAIKSTCLKSPIKFRLKHTLKHQSYSLMKHKVECITYTHKQTSEPLTFLENPFIGEKEMFYPIAKQWQWNWCCYLVQVFINGALQSGKETLVLLMLLSGNSSNSMIELMKPKS